MDGLLGVNRFEDFLKARAEKLAEFATAYVQSLG
jgi:hypothetical protein